LEHTLKKDLLPFTNSVIRFSIIILPQENYFLKIKIQFLLNLRDLTKNNGKCAWIQNFQKFFLQLWKEKPLMQQEYGHKP